jgi:hypothetical protein
LTQEGIFAYPFILSRWLRWGMTASPLLHCSLSFHLYAPVLGLRNVIAFLCSVRLFPVGCILECDAPLINSDRALTARQSAIDDCLELRYVCHRFAQDDSCRIGRSCTRYGSSEIQDLFIDRSKSISLTIRVELPYPYCRLFCSEI